MISLQTDRLNIVPFDYLYLKDYYEGFNENITKYQYPDPFPTEAAAGEMLQEFVELMNRGEMLFLCVLTKDGEFAGSVEVHGLVEENPELGIWIKEEHQHKGYAWEALHSVIEAVDREYGKQWYVYEADIRNLASMKLVEKFHYEKDDFQEFETETGKTLKLQTFFIKLL